MLLPSKSIIYYKPRPASKASLVARQLIFEGGYDLQNTLKQQLKLINQVVRG